ncbi:MAG: HEAT repeat domain-containing protein, partial [Bdellovibrionota bacterium]
DDKASYGDAVRVSRVAILIELAGKSKNKAALPALRRISKKGGIPADLAQKAIGQIGEPEDLDAFIDEVKHNPRSRLDFSGFGPGIIDRIMREVDNPKLDDSARAALIARLGQATGPDATGKLRELTRHKDRRVAESAAFALGKSIPSGDAATSLELLKDPNREVRFNGLLALESKAWSEEKVPVLIEMMKKDPDEGVRAQAAKILGRKRAQTAEPALREAL